MDLCMTMGCTLAELGERMSNAELALWRTRYMVSPFGERRDDERGARLHQLIEHVNVAKGKGTKDHRDLYPFARKAGTGRSQTMDQKTVLSELAKVAPGRIKVERRGD